jgi:hypothetical protein
VHDAGSALIVFLLRDPHLLEGAERGQDGATNPDAVLALWWGDDADLHAGWGEGGDLLLHAVADAGVHGGAAGLGSCVSRSANEGRLCVGHTMTMLP